MNNLTTSILGNHAAQLGNPPFVAMEPSLTGRSEALISRVGRFSSPLLVCDANTYSALGKRIQEELGNTTLHILPEPVHADMMTVERLLAHPCDAMIAVGSGTINDLCKLASYRKNIPYVVFPTAPSMNGYVSPNASIATHGFKTSQPAHMPAGVFCDLDVLSNAPYRLIRSGVGDVMCRSTCQVDWYTSHVLLGTYYSDIPFALLAPHEKQIVAMAHTFPERNHDAIHALMMALLAGGFGMALCGGSYPASQGEHLIAHTMEMFFAESAHAYHGEEIAVTTLVMERIQRTFLSRETLDLVFDRSDTFNNVPDVLRQDAIRETHTKYGMENLRMLSIAGGKWNALRQTVRAMMLPEGTLHNTLAAAQCPLIIEDLGWNAADFSIAEHNAHLMRNRFTFLDIAALYPRPR
jgi:glycerol-1-phosphate dehydrogenase [NAD(P)+]